MRLAMPQVSVLVWFWSPACTLSQQHQPTPTHTLVPPPDDAITVRVAPSVTTSLTSVPGEAEASKSSRGRKRGTTAPHCGLSLHPPPHMCGHAAGRASDDDDDDDDDDDGTSGTASSSKRKRLTSSGASATGGGAGGGAGASATGADSASESGKHVPYTKLFEPHESAVSVASHACFDGPERGSRSRTCLALGVCDCRSWLKYGSKRAEEPPRVCGFSTCHALILSLSRCIIPCPACDYCALVHVACCITLLTLLLPQVEGGGSTAELLTNLFPNDTGTDTPRLSNHHLVAAGHSSTSRGRWGVCMSGVAPDPKHVCMLTPRSTLTMIELQCSPCRRSCLGDPSSGHSGCVACTS